MNATPAIADRATVKGWCPGALKPMLTGDGLIVRVRARCGALSVAQMIGLSGIARRHGNGLIDLTRRANVQIRGVEASALPRIWATLSECDLIDAHAEAEAVRNVMVSPLAGVDLTEICDVRPIAAALEADLTPTRALWSLPGKFGFAVDGGGMLSLDGERADIRLKATRTAAGAGIAIGIDTARDTQWLRLVDFETAHTAAIRLATAFLAAERKEARSRMRDLGSNAISDLARALEPFGETLSDCPAPQPGPTPDRVGLIAPRDRATAVGLGAPFGRIEAQALERMAEVARELGIAALRLSPWRVLYAPVTGAHEATRLIAAANECGLVTTPGHPLMAIDACPGAPACRSARLDTRAAALRIAGMMPLPGVASVHISGCAKGCARSKKADLVLVDCDSTFAVIRNGTAAASPVASLAPADLDELPTLLAAGA